jgi:hypothetical protein
VKRNDATENEWSRLRVKVRQTHVGRGLFADAPFEAEQPIAELAGRIINDPDYRSVYCIDLGGAFSLEPHPPFAYLNHSCDPNSELLCVDAENEAGATIELVTLRPIGAGEELTIDYAWPAESAIRCGCGSTKCRGWVVDVAELDQVDLADE